MSTIDSNLVNVLGWLRYEISFSDVSCAVISLEDKEDSVEHWGSEDAEARLIKGYNQEDLQAFFEMIDINIHNFTLNFYLNVQIWMNDGSFCHKICGEDEIAIVRIPEIPKYLIKE
jgi:hypothetical protein